VGGPAIPDRCGRISPAYSRSSSADRGGYVSVDEDERGWVVCLLRPERQEFRAVEPEQAPAWWVVRLMLGELRGAALAGA